jgi:glycosyltransferase involved in cell wall biosynthesis
VLWLEPPRPEGFTRHELVQLYRVSDVVADDFGIGWFGAVALEGLATERPVVTYIDDAVMSTLYPWHPMVSARTAADVADRLTELARDPELRREIGTEGRRWVEAFHSHDKAGEIYVSQILALAGRLGLDGA